MCSYNINTAIHNLPQLHDRNEVGAEGVVRKIIKYESTTDMYGHIMVLIIDARMVVYRAGSF